MAMIIISLTLTKGSTIGHSDSPHTQTMLQDKWVLVTMLQDKWVLVYHSQSIFNSATPISNQSATVTLKTHTVTDTQELSQQHNLTHK